METKVTARRVSELFTDSTTVESEYWLKDSATCAVVVLDTIDPAGLTATLDRCREMFSITLLPVISIDEGLRILHEVTQEPLMVFG